MNINTLAELKKHSGHFFDRRTMAFFNSRVESGIYRTGEATGYIVTSEKYREEPREYRIRKYEPSNLAPVPVRIDIVREFGTREEAMHTARAWAKRDRSEN